MKNTSAIIMASGVGTRFLPAAKAFNKCLMPLGEKPIIQHVVEECLNAGITKIIIVVRPWDDSIKKHFSSDPNLKSLLQKTDKNDTYEQRVAPTEKMGKSIRFCHHEDTERYGTTIPVAAALDQLPKTTKRILIMNGDATCWPFGQVKQALDDYPDESQGVIFGFKVPLHTRHVYGVLIQDDKDPRKVQEIIEKPKSDVSPKSLYANAGWYIMPMSIRKKFTDLKPDPKSGEYLLTDIINEQIKDAPCYIHTISGPYLDCGDPRKWLASNNFITQPIPIQTPQRLQDDGIQIIRMQAHDMPEDYIQQIVEKSRQAHIMEFEGHEDVGDENNPGRFRSLEAYRSWASGKDRTVYLMTKKGHNSDRDDVGGIIWFGERPNEHAADHSTTFAIRHYTADDGRGWGEFLGKGYGTPFMQASHADLQEVNPYARLWLGVTEGNQRAYSLYEKLGYRELTRIDNPDHPDKARIIMVRS